VLTASQIYNQLLTGKSVTVSFPSKKDCVAFHSSLRTVKSRYDRRYKELFSESLSEGKVIACDIITETPEIITAKFTLGARKQNIPTSFTVLSITSQ